LSFPGWFGANWDALADCLGDLSWLLAPGYLLMIENSGTWRAAEGAEFDTLLAILNEAALEWRERNVAFWALLPLPSGELARLESTLDADRVNLPEGGPGHGGPCAAARQGQPSAGSDPVVQADDAGLARAVGAAVNRSVMLAAVTDDPALAVGTGGRQRVDRTLERIKGAAAIDGFHREALVVVVAADIAG